MTYNQKDGYRYSGRGRGSLRISLSSRSGARSISSDMEKPLDAESCYIAGLSLEDFPPIQPSTSGGSSSNATGYPSSSKLKHGGYGSDGIKVYFQNPHKYTGNGRGGTISRPGARSTFLRQHALSAYAEDDEEKAPTGGYGSESIKASGPVVPRGGLQAAGQQCLETGPQNQNDSSLESDLDEFY